MNHDVARVLDEFVREISRLVPGRAPDGLVERTRFALREAFTAAAGSALAPAWARLYHDAGLLIEALDANGDPALPGLRAFLAENADLRDLEPVLI